MRQAVDESVRKAMLNGGDGHDSIRLLYQRMADEARFSGGSASESAARHAPKILRQALAARIIPEDELRTLLKERNWSSALDQVHVKLRRQQQQQQQTQTITTRRLASGVRDSDIYEQRDARGRLLRVIATRAGSAPSDSATMTLHDALRARAATDRSVDDVVARTASLLRWIARHGADAGLSAHPALNSGAVRVGADCVAVVGWDAARLHSLNYFSEGDDDPLARAAARIDAFVAAP